MAVAAALALASCGEQNGPAAIADRDPATTRDLPANASATPADSPRSVYDSAAVDLQSLFDKLSTKPPAPTPGQAGAKQPTPPPAASASKAPPTPDPLPAPLPNATPPVVGLEAPAVTAVPPPQPPAPPEPTARDKRLEYAKQLAKLLIPSGDDKQSPLRAALPLIALETIQPGVAKAELDRLMASLSPSERGTIESVRTMMAQLEAQADSGADPKALAQTVRGAVDRAQPAPLLPPAQPAGTASQLALGTVALCKRVEAFGRFTPYPGSSFVAGRKVPLIVYTEVENYTQAREADLPSAAADGARRASSGRWALELSQEVHVYAADGTLCWFVKEQKHRDTSASKRRDFFLVQRIDLPSSLTIGRYTLKVIIRDKAAPLAGTTKGFHEPLAEANIPLFIVADAAAAAADTRRPVASALDVSPEAVGDSR